MEYRATENWIISLANQYCIGKLKRNQGLRFTIRLDVENFGYEKDGNTHHPEWMANYWKGISIIILSSHRVFISTAGNWFGSNAPAESYKNTSNHDSCWREDGLRVIWEEVIKGYDLCFGHVPKEHRHAPVSAHIVTSPCNDSVMDFVEVQYDRDGDYRYKLKEIKVLKPTISFEEATK